MKNKKEVLLLREKTKIAAFTLVCTCCVAVLFYRSLWGCLWAPVLYVVLYKRVKESGKEQQKEILLEQFVQGIRILNTSLQAGFSMENAWIEVQKELEVLYGRESIFVQEVREINRLVSLNNPIEKCFGAFAQETEVEEIMQFAEILEYGKRSGGSWRRIIGAAAERMREKFEAKKEIEVMIAEKKMEQQVMNIIPLGIIMFLQISSWDYIRVMYHNPLGVLCMTILFIGYGISLILAEKIMKIKV